ncbi:MAG: hypothetical protein WC381_10745 [Kiritimatiellia bacterium]|jgi:hypothetical protein
MLIDYTLTLDVRLDVEVGDDGEVMSIKLLPCGLKDEIDGLLLDPKFQALVDEALDQEPEQQYLADCDREYDAARDLEGE